MKEATSTITDSSLSLGPTGFGNTDDFLCSDKDECRSAETQLATLFAAATLVLLTLSAWGSAEECVPVLLLL